MTDQTTTDIAQWSSELQAFLEKLRYQTIRLTLPGLCVAGLVIMGATVRFRDPYSGILLALAPLLLALAVWLVSRWSYLAAAYLLVLGCLAAELLLIIEGDVTPVIYLLVIPVGLAALTISRAAGLLMAAACTLLLLLAPPSLLPGGLTPRAIAAVAVWSTVSMIWLTFRPLLQAVDWAWSGYARSQDLLKQARDYRQQFQETLEDLTKSNVQLTRLNRQADTLRQVAEEERQAKEQFVANVSHELRTPLNMIVGFCEMITQSPETYGDAIPPALLADLAVVLRNSQHLSSLIDDVLDMSQIEARQMALTKERVALREIVQAAAVAVRPLYESKALYLETDIPEDMPPILCDRTRIREVLLNLLSNAGRFTERGGVRIQARQEGNDVVVSVTDTGPGITESAQKKIFQPFQQLDNTIRRRFGGTGLGLSISKNFVELHDGEMWIESQVGQGTTVSFRLPIDPAKPIKATPVGRLIQGWEFLQRTRPSQAPVAEISPRLVVMEQGHAMQRLLSRYLDGVEVVAVADLEQAIREMEAVPTQALLINDLHVENVLRRLNQAAILPYGVPAIICSTPGVEQAASDLGAVDYLVKPVSREMLLNALDRLEREVRTVLIVDDDPDALRLFRRMLVMANRDYRVLRATNGRQALEILAREAVDAILLDLIMPEMDGFQLLAIKSHDPALRDVPVILISARDPLGQPIVSKSLAVTSRDGLSASELLASIETLNAILSKTGPPDAPEQSERPPD